jgi:hypothetical protein
MVNRNEILQLKQILPLEHKNRPEETEDSFTHGEFQDESEDIIEKISKEDREINESQEGQDIRSSLELIQQIRDNYEVLKMRHGEEIAERYMLRLMGGTNRKYNMVKLNAEKLVSLKEARKQAMEKMEEFGVLSRSPEDFLLCDLEKMKTIFRGDEFKKRELGGIFYSKSFGGQDFSKTLTLLFKGINVISKDDYENGVREPKPLYYLPESAESALDVGKIKKSDFYLTLFESAQPNNYDSAKYGNIKDLDYREVLVPLLIYHPRFGSGYRDPDTGALYVKDQKSGKPKRISGEYFQKDLHFSSFGPSRKGARGRESMRTPYQFVSSRLPHLVEKKLLLPEDFKINTGFLKGSERISKPLQQRGVAMFNRVQHVLGNRFYRDDMRVYMISPVLGGIVQEKADGQKVLVATFNIFSKEDRFKTPKGYYAAGVNDTRTTDFDQEDFFQKRYGENEEEFNKRTQKIKDFTTFLEASAYLSSKAAVDLGSFNSGEQQQLLSVMKNLNYKGNSRLIDFAKRYGEQGVRVFVALEHDKNMGERIFQIGEKVNQEAAEVIFEKYNELISLSANLEGELADSIRDEGKLKDLDIEEIRKEIARRANNFLEKFAEKISDADQPERAGSIKAIIRALEECKKEVVVTASTYKEAKKKGLGFEEMMGARYREITARELSSDQGMLKQMEDIYQGNYKYEPKLQKKIVPAFVDRINSGTDRTKVYYFRKGGGVISFARIDTLGSNQKYFGSFNVAPEFQEAAVGSDLSDKIFKKEGAENDIWADSDPRESRSTQKYIEKNGFVVTKVHPNYEGTGVFLFGIFRERDTTRDSQKFALRGMSKEELVRKHEKDFPGNNYSEKDQQIILKFEPLSEEMKREVIHLVNERGYRLTRYFFDSDNETVFCGFERVPS